MRYNTASGSGIYLGYGLRIETGAWRIQNVRDTGIHLKVEDQWKITQGSQKQASGYDPHMCDVWATAPRHSSCIVKNPYGPRV